MNEPGRGASEKLVEVHKAHDEWAGNLLAGYLRDNGIEAAFQGDPNVSFDLNELIKSSNEAFGIFVLEQDVARATELINEFLAAVTDPTVLEETAAQKLQLDKETIGRLRGELTEERRTFAFLGWIGATFLGAGALLWIIWPAWLKMETPPSGFRWIMVILLILGAVIAGRSTNK